MSGGILSAASHVDDVVHPETRWVPGYAYDAVRKEGFTFPWYYNPPHRDGRSQAMIRTFYINPNGFLSMDQGYPLCGLSGIHELPTFCSDIMKYTNFIGVFTTDFNPGARATASIHYKFLPHLHPPPFNTSSPLHTPIAGSRGAGRRAMDRGAWPWGVPQRSAGAHRAGKLSVHAVPMGAGVGTSSLDRELAARRGGDAGAL